MLPLLLPLDGRQRHPPEHVTFAVVVSAVGAGVVLVVRAAAVDVVVIAGVDVVDGTSMDHEAVKPLKAVKRSDVNSTRKTPIFDVYVLHRALACKAVEFDPDNVARSVHGLEKDVSVHLLIVT